MNHEIFKPNPTNKYPFALLCKSNTFDRRLMYMNYVQPLMGAGIELDQIIALTLQYDDAKKVSAKTIKSYSENLLKALDRVGVQYAYVADGKYFKYLTGEKKTDVHVGYVLDCAIKGFEHIKIAYGLNYQQLAFAPEKQSIMRRGLEVLADHSKGEYVPPGAGIIHSEVYPDDLASIKAFLDGLHKHPQLAIDIEAFGLKLDEAGVGTIAFAWDEHNFGAFKVDLEELPEQNEQGHYSKRVDNPARRKLVREFLEAYQGAMVMHHAVFDTKHLIYNLWMEDPLDLEGHLRGLDVMSRKLHCTRVMTYLASNSCAGNHLSLKHQAQSFAGNYAVDDIKDIRKEKVPTLLRYNGVDTISTFWLAKKWYPVLIDEKQIDLYNGLFRDSLRLLVHVELNGMPMNPAKVTKVYGELQDLQKGYMDAMMSNPLVDKLNLWLQTKEMDKVNAGLKTKVHPLTMWSDPASSWYKSFNPGSGQQLAQLLYEFMGLPIIETTDTGLPSTGAKIIERLLDHDLSKPHLSFLQALIDWSQVTTILSTFMPAFENGQLKADGMRYLHGAFNLGGTKSGRLSSSDPNMQNIPAGSIYGKLVKSLFEAAEGWLFAGADFNSLEDYISALTTKDPNKLKVYEEGFDGHALRAAFYFKDDLEKEGIFIDTTDPKSVNQLKKDDHPKRQESKAPTFLLTYGGTHHGMMKNLGWTKAKSLAIEANYHNLYQVSDQYVADRIAKARKDGYVEVAFGLRLRTPALHATIGNSKFTPSQASGEGRTAGNALGQSYGLLNNRAACAFMKRVWASEHRYNVKCVALIHDAIYLVMKNCPKVVEWVNRALIEEMSWQELPELQHPTVKLGAALDIFYPTWANPVTLPVAANEDTIRAVCKQHMVDLKLKKVA